MKSRKLLLLIIFALIFTLSNILGKREDKQTQQVEQGNLQTLAVAIQDRKQHVWVKGQGVVVALLPDDTQGSRHQRILVSTDNTKNTVLIAHNIDLAPRVANLAKGDLIDFSGEYIWNNKGGVLHWTHHDPQGHKKGGWIKFHGKKYQ